MDGFLKSRTGLEERPGRRESKEVGGGTHTNREEEILHRRGGEMGL